MNLTEKERKYLRDYNSKKLRFAYGLIIIAPIYLCIMAVLNFYLANRYGSHDGITIIDIFFDWHKGIDVIKNYSYTGWSLKAQERFTAGLLELFLAILLGIAAYSAGAQRKFIRKIIEILRRHNEL